MDQNQNRPELQESSDVLTKFADVMENAKKELFSSIKSKELCLVEASRTEITALKKKLHDERVTNSLLNQRISELTEEKKRSELSLELAQDSKEDVERRLQQEMNQRKQLEVTLTEESSVNNKLRLVIDRLTAEIKERANEKLSTSSPSNSFDNAEDKLIATTNITTGKATFQKSDSLVQENKSSSAEKGLQVSAMVPVAEARLILTDNIQQQQQYLSPSDSEQVRIQQGDEEELESSQESLTVQEESSFSDKSTLFDEADFPLSLSPSPLNQFILKIEQESTVEPAQHKDGTEIRVLNTEEPEATRTKQTFQNFLKLEEEQPQRKKARSELLSSTSSSDEENDDVELESAIKSSSKLPTYMTKTEENSESPMVITCDDSDFEDMPENPGISSPSYDTELPYEYRSPDYRESSSSNDPPGDRHDISFNLSDPSYRKRTSCSSPSGPSQPTAKFPKKSGEFPVSTSSLTAFPNPNLQSDIHNTTNATNSSPVASSLSSEDSVLKVPELYRINYGFLDNYLLDRCPHARNFWYDSLHASSTKYFIRFYDDDECGKWGVTTQLTVKEQVGLAEPVVFQLKFSEIVQRLEENMRKPGGIRIWTDVRDFNIFSHNFSQFFQDFGPFVTHFSFGRRLYSDDDVGGDYLLSFIFKKLYNVEYLAFNDRSMKRLDFGFSLSRTVRDNCLKKLKTLRLINMSFIFGTPFIMAILLRAPVLSSVYGLPLHLLDEIEQQFLKQGKESPENSPWLVKAKTENSSKDSPEIFCTDSLKSVAVYGHLYNTKSKYSSESGSLSYPDDLETLCRLGPRLEELDLRTFFISSSKAQKLCLERMSEILQLSSRSLKRLRIQPLGGTRIESLTFPRLKKCETLQLDMTLIIKSGQRYFPDRMDLSLFFPNLKTIEISIDDRSGDGEQNTIQNSLEKNKAIDLFYAHFRSEAFCPGETPQLKTVQQLNLIKFTPPDLMDKFHRLFPYITILGLNQTLAVLSQVLPRCFQLWRQLKQLILHVTFFNCMEKNLDSAFTGIPPGGCQILEKFKAQNIQGRIDKYRKQTSICNLKDLTLLKIVFFHPGEMNVKIQGSLMTPVSAIYGFGKERMPGLNVVIGFDARLGSQERLYIMQHLEPMQRYVTIDE